MIERVQFSHHATRCCAFGLRWRLTRLPGCSLIYLLTRLHICRPGYLFTRFTSQSVRVILRCGRYVLDVGTVSTDFLYRLVTARLRVHAFVTHLPFTPYVLPTTRFGFSHTARLVVRFISILALRFTHVNNVFIHVSSACVAAVNDVLKLQNTVAYRYYDRRTCTTSGLVCVAVLVRFRFTFVRCQRLPVYLNARTTIYISTLLFSFAFVL